MFLKFLLTTLDVPLKLVLIVIFIIQIRRSVRFSGLHQVVSHSWGNAFRRRAS